jgi:hypothetical protein
MEYNAVVTASLPLFTVFFQLYSLIPQNSSYTEKYVSN